MSDIGHQDEILQMLYWMRGEQIGDSVSIEQLDRFLQIGTVAIESALGSLRDRSLIRVLSGGTPRFSLTPEGVEEGRRRFLDEFSGVLGQDSHMECGDPSCDCHSEDFVGSCLNL